MTVSVVLLAAGRGRRMGLEVNKTLLPVAGVPMVARAAATLGQTPDLIELVVVAHSDELAVVASLLPPLDVAVRVVAGGAERRDSSLAGVAAATGDVVLVHDAARPLVSLELIERVLEGARRYGACTPAIPVVDTLRRVDARGFAAPGDIARDGLVRVQTPQGFRRVLLEAALRAWPPGVPLTDDAAAALSAGIRVAVVDGDESNMKITVPRDLELATRVATLPQSA